MDKFANVIDASPETILCGGHIRTSDATAFSTCKSLDLNFSRCATKVSSCYLLVEDKQRSSGVNVRGTTCLPPRRRGTQRYAEKIRPPRTKASLGFLCLCGNHSVELATALESAFQINGSVPQVWPRCCGRKPKSTSRPFPTLTSASAIWPLSLSSPSNQPLNSTFSFAYRAMTRTFESAAAVNAE